MFGAYLLVSGIAQVMLAFGLHTSAGGRFLFFLSGAVSVVLAVLAFRHFGEGYALLLLAIWVGIGFIFRGTAVAAAAASDHGHPGRGSAILCGIATVLAGVITLAYPFDSIAVLTLVVGAWLVVIGLFEIGAAFAIRKELRAIQFRISSVQNTLGPMVNGETSRRPWGQRTWGLPQEVGGGVDQIQHRLGEHAQHEGDRQ